MQQRNTLQARERLKSRKIIQQLFAEGKSFGLFPLRVIYKDVEDDQPPLQAAFSVSTRHFKKAVDRNRIKRLLRETYRLHKHALQLKLAEEDKKVAVFFIYTGKELPEYRVILEKMTLALGKLENNLFRKEGL